MARRLSAAAAALLLLTTLAACGGEDEPSGLSTLTPGSSESSTSAPTGTPSGPASTSGPAASKLPDTVAVHRRKVVAKTPAETAVAEVFVRYITVRLTAYNKVEVDLDALAKAAIGPALNAVKSDVSNLRNRKEHTVGEVWVDISQVAVSGTKATVTSCMDNTTVDVDSKGKPTDLPKPFYNIRSTVELVGGKVWLVSAITFGGEKACR